MDADIVSRGDVEKLVNAFYQKVKSDALLAPVFQDVDWPHHLPVMYSFWSSILLGEQGYRGNPFLKHMNLAIGEHHFERWLFLFRQTVDEYFSGQKATEAKERADSIAGLFQYKMGIAERR